MYVCLIVYSMSVPRVDDPDIADGSPMRGEYACYAGIIHSSWLYGMSHQHPSCILSLFSNQTTRAVLGDAIAMVRGDRYSTIDFTRKPSFSFMDYDCMLILSRMKAANLTAWGYEDCRRHFNNGGNGAESQSEHSPLTLNISSNISCHVQCPNSLHVYYLATSHMHVSIHHFICFSFALTCSSRTIFIVSSPFSRRLIWRKP